LKRGMRMLAPPEMKLSLKTWWKKELLELLHQSILELHLPIPPHGVNVFLLSDPSLPSCGGCWQDFIC